MAETKSVHCVEDLVREVTHHLLASETHSHIRIWFRGQEKADWSLQPGIYRTNAASEADRLELERQLNHDFQIESAGLLSGRETRAELYFLQQHYGLNP